MHDHALNISVCSSPKSGQVSVKYKICEIQHCSYKNVKKLNQRREHLKILIAAVVEP